MRVAVITETFLPKIDGIVTMVTHTVQCLRAAGDEVLVFAPGSPGTGTPAEIFGAEVVSVPSLPFPLYPELRLAAPRAFMRAKLEVFRPEVLHLFEPTLLGIGGLYYSSVLDAPAVLSYHTNLPAYVRHYGLGPLEGLTWALLRQRHARADVNLCTSSPMLEDLRSHGINRLALWQRAVDAERFNPAKRSASLRDALSGHEPHKPLLLYVGRLSAEKEVGSLRSVMEGRPDARLAIIGDGPMRKELERQFRNTATVLVGYLHGEALAEAYASADLLLMPSRTETLGLVLLEAMASGCAVIAPRAGGIPDAVADGVTGLLYDPADPQALLQAVHRLLTDEGLRDRLRSRARAEVEAYSWTRSTEQLRGYYAEAIAHRRARRNAGTPASKPRSPLTKAAKQITLHGLRRLLP